VERGVLYHAQGILEDMGLENELQHDRRTDEQRPQGKR